MARITPSSLISDIRGKAADQIFSRNAYGAYVKAYATPIQPDTAKQIARRDNMQDIVAAWKVINPADRALWKQIATTLAPPAKRWPHKSLTDYNLYVRCNCLRDMAGLSILDIPSSISQPVSVSLTDYACTTDELVTGLTSSDTSEEWATLIYASNIFSPSRQKPNGCEFKFLGFEYASSTQVITDWTSTYATLWTSLIGQGGNILFLRFRNVNLANGQVLPMQVVRLEIMEV